MCKVMHKNGLTRKKLTKTALQRSFEFRGAFMASILQGSFLSGLTRQVVTGEINYVSLDTLLEDSQPDVQDFSPVEREYLPWLQCHQMG